MGSWASALVVAFALLEAGGVQAALPEPPKQHEPWQPRSGTSVPDFVVRVAGVLFDAGLADPGGGDYREVEIFDLKNGKKTVQTHAWVFPGEFAVCWNGLVYRVRSKGPVAGLDKDVQTILSAEPRSGRFPVFFRVRSQSDHSNAAFWYDLQTNQTIVPASIALLLRLGRADLAERLWNAPEAPNDENEEGLWLATSATAWFAAAYGRLVGAFGAGDDQEAVDVAESLLKWRSRVPDSWRVENRWVPKRVPDISFLDPVPELAADATRRLREPKRTDLNLQAISANKGDAAGFFRMPQAMQIRELIERLEDVRADKVSFPGLLAFSFDPDYELLEREGGAAVEALIGAYGNDKRLTRTFDYSRPWSIVFTPVPVRQVAELLLKDILGEAVVSGKSAPELLAWWRQHHSGESGRAKSGNARQ